MVHIYLYHNGCSPEAVGWIPAVKLEHSGRLVLSRVSQQTYQHPKLSIPLNSN